MLARPPTNLPGGAVGSPDRPNKKKCPHCKEDIEIVKLNRHTVRCPNCNGKVQISKKDKSK